jgi:hypothetical protein
MPQATLRGGVPVRFIDLSPVSALIETTGRLLPGSSTAIHVGGPSIKRTMAGHIVRVYIASLVRQEGEIAVRYRGAIRFVQPFATSPGFENLSLLCP